jgi:hypothetical protein
MVNIRKRINVGGGPGESSSSSSLLLLPLTINDVASYEPKRKQSSRIRQRHKTIVSLDPRCCGWVGIVTFMSSVVGCCLILITAVRQIRQDEDHPTKSNHIFTPNIVQHLVQHRLMIKQIIPAITGGRTNRNVIQNIQQHQITTTTTTVECLDGSIGYLNDNYCDCLENGIDEPQTSACSHVLLQYVAFTCQAMKQQQQHDSSTTNNNETPTPPTFMIPIYPSRIRDGIQDCLDGSDEQ